MLSAKRHYVNILSSQSQPTPPTKHNTAYISKTASIFLIKSIKSVKPLLIHDFCGFSSFWKLYSSILAASFFVIFLVDAHD